MKARSDSQHREWEGKSIEELGATENGNVSAKKRNSALQGTKIIAEATMTAAIGILLFNGSLTSAIRNTLPRVEYTVPDFFSAKDRKQEVGAISDTTGVDKSGVYFIKELDTTDGKYDFSMIKNKHGDITGFVYKQK